jgi:hypothetical protein
MYKLEVKKNPNSDISTERYKSDIQDIANVIPDKISDVEDDAVAINSNTLSFDSLFSEKKIKGALKSTFIYHNDNVLFVSLSKC